jgi:ACS family hexuronate transporter-like MFS transporter
MTSPDPAQLSNDRRTEPPARRRWGILALLFVVAVINYFDRQSLSALAPKLQAELHLSDVGYAHIVSLFLGASAVAYALAGFVSDALGARLSVMVFVGFWSLAEAATTFATSVLSLGIARFCLGLGEPGLWVAAPKAVGETFPKHERSLAIGIYTAGATAGAVISLPIIHAIAGHLPWRSVFLIDGAVGLLWVPFWMMFYRAQPNDTAFADGSHTASYVDRSENGVRHVLRRSTTWRLVIARAVTDPVWYFYLFWFPKFLASARHMDAAQIADRGWTVYLFAGVGTLAGGFAARMLIRRGVTEGRAYRAIMTVAALLLPFSPLCALSSSNGLAVAVACVAAVAHMAWLVTLTALVVRLYPPRQIGKAAGLIAAGSGIGGFLSSEAIGASIGTHGYTPAFLVMAILHPLALLLLWRVFREPSPSAGALD